MTIKSAFRISLHSLLGLYESQSLDHNIITLFNIYSKEVIHDVVKYSIYSEFFILELYISAQVEL